MGKDIKKNCGKLRAADSSSVIRSLKVFQSKLVTVKNPFNPDTETLAVCQSQRTFTSKYRNRLTQYQAYLSMT